MIRHHPLLAFPVIYLGWAYVFWTPVITPIPVSSRSFTGGCP